ncbi:MULTISPECIES: winged helix-turn-helix domain-containing protein [unclassified Photobacterium]|uniref:winged helix-turn-helix domain-containing protein n=1 Tax=unclassified Photobacterium TaxID=2628852 RepID=UPI001EDF2FBA|nr:MULTISPECIES: winged helix-turn-helix domain-containing protein [unclassified Photobacterium]MCG3866130.1 winged helix-turn-helix domain-containing protein [Photobacterium sp. Ph6]MCG3877674.1 winged helix-turn-helix domain-containing protein [Photobacterium sp. Ph5]
MPNTEQIRFQTKVCYIESQGVLKTPESTLKLNLSEQYILSYLIDNYGKPVTKDELLNVGWPDRIVTEASLFQVIRALRVKLNEEKKGDVIETLPRVGYQIREFTREAIDLSESQHLSPLKRVGKKTALLSAITLAVITSGIAWMKYPYTDSPKNYLIDKDRVGSNDFTFITSNAEDLADLRGKVKDIIKKQTEKYGEVTTKNQQIYLYKTDSFYSAAWCTVNSSKICEKNTDFSYKIVPDEWDQFADIVINNKKKYHGTPIIHTENTQEPTSIAYASYIDKSGIQTKVMHLFLTPTSKDGIFNYSMMSFIQEKETGMFHPLSISAAKAKLYNKNSQFLKTVKIEPEMFHWSYQPSANFDEKQSLALKHSNLIEQGFNNNKPFFSYLVYKQPHLVLMLDNATGFVWNKTSDEDPSVIFSYRLSSKADK